MEESSTYRAIVRRGRIEEAQRMLLLQGQTKFGPPDDATRNTLNSINDPERLEEIGVRMLSAASWQELLPLPARRRNGRRRTGG